MVSLRELLEEGAERFKPCSGIPNGSSVLSVMFPARLRMCPMPTSVLEWFMCLAFASVVADSLLIEVGGFVRVIAKPKGRIQESDWMSDCVLVW